jgi:hypothetical protein
LKEVLIIVKSTIEKSPRSSRFLDFCLKNNLNITLICGGVENSNITVKDSYIVPILEKSKFVRIFFKFFKLVINVDFLQRLSNTYLYNLKTLNKLLKINRYDFIYFADIDLLPVVIRNAHNAITIFDAREYYPLQFENNLNFRIFEKTEYTRILNRYLNKCDKVYTVSEGLANAYKLKFNTNTSLIFSCPYFKNINVKEIENNKIKLLYHGMANRNRKIENYFDLLKLINHNCELHLYLVGDKDYINDLKIQNKDNKKVQFHEPVHLDEIVDMANNYDIGLCYFEPTTFNLKHCLPNKYFEYIQARIIVATGPSPDMYNILNKYNCGIISKEFTTKSLADSINSLSISDLNAKKRNTEIAALELCFEKQEDILKTDLRIN